MPVEWQNTREPLPERILRGAELLLGVEFPWDYRECVRLNHRGHPDPNTFRVEGITTAWGSCVGELLSPDPRAPENVWATIAHLYVDGPLPDGLVPVTDDGGGDLVCLDYRGGPESPRVVYWSHEVGGVEGITPIADTFTAFLSLLG